MPGPPPDALAALELAALLLLMMIGDGLLGLFCDKSATCLPQLGQITQSLSIWLPQCWQNFLLAELFIGVPQLGQCIAFSEIAAPHSGHLIIAIVFSPSFLLQERHGLYSARTLQVFFYIHKYTMFFPEGQQKQPFKDVLKNSEKRDRIN